MKGTQIVIPGEPRGIFLEGIIYGALYPGVKMQIKANVLPVGGRHTWQVYTPSANSDPRLTAILREDNLQGKTAADAYVSGTRCFMYVPLPGEELNVLVEGEAGTGSANAFFVGDRLTPVTGTGMYKLLSVSSTKADFVCLEHIDEVPNTATLVWVIAQ